MDDHLEKLLDGIFLLKSLFLAFKKDTKSFLEMLLDSYILSFLFFSLSLQNGLKDRDALHCREICGALLWIGPNGPLNPVIIRKRKWPINKWAG